MGDSILPVFPQEHPQVLEDMDNDEECVEMTILTPVDMSGMVGTSSPHTMSDLVAYIDGGSLGNPGPSGIGVVIDGSTDGTIRIAKWIGHQDKCRRVPCPARSAAMCPGA